MKTIQSLIATAALVVASATAADAQSTKPGATAPASPATRTAEDDRAIRKVLAALDVAWNTHEMKALERLFHEDAEFINVVGMHWRGRPAIVAAHVAYHKTIFKDVGMKHQNKLSYVFTKRAGEWKIAHAQNVRIDAAAAQHDPVNSPRK